MQGPNDGKATPTAPAIGSDAHSLHLFKVEGRTIEVDVFNVDAAEWSRNALPLGPLCSTFPLGDGRIRVVRLSI